MLLSLYIQAKRTETAVLCFQISLFSIQTCSVKDMVKICKPVQGYCHADCRMFLIFRDTLVVCVSFCMPYFIIIEVVSLRILDVEADRRDSVHREICMV